MEKKAATFAEVKQEILAKVQNSPSNCELITEASRLADVLLPRCIDQPSNTFENILSFKSEIYDLHLRGENGCQNLQHRLEIYKHIDSIG